MTPLPIRTPQSLRAQPGGHLSLTDSEAAIASVRRPWIACAACVGVLLLALFALAALQYRMPQNYACLIWGHNPPAARQWQNAFLPHSLAALDAQTYRAAFRGLLCFQWAAYALAIVFALRRGALPFPAARVVVMGTAFAFAVFAPPVLATDSYAYVAYARLYALYGQNPYVCLPAYLALAKDPTVPFLFWNLPTVYGPLWTLLTATVVAVLHAAPLWPQVLAMKFIEAFALVLAAFAGRRVAESFAPGRGDLAFLALGLNPLLLLEGPGSGHNDLLMMALLLAGVALQRRGRFGPAALLLGVSIGIKFVTLLAVPWLILTCVRDRRGWDRVRLGAGLALTALLPTMMGYLPFWHGAATFAGLQMRSQIGQTAEALAQNARLGMWLTEHGCFTNLATSLSALGHQWPVVIVYAALTAWLWRKKSAEWLAAWPVLAASLMFWTMGAPSPWFLTWLWVAGLTRWGRGGLVLSAVTLVASLTEEWLYGRWMPI